MSLMRIMLFVLLAGLLLTGWGLYLLFFAPSPGENGIEGIFLTVTLITAGLLLLIPAKIYIIIQLMRWEKRSGKNDRRSESGTLP